MKLTDYLIYIVLFLVVITATIMLYKQVTRNVDGFVNLDSALAPVIALADKRSNGRRDVHDMIDYYTSTGSDSHEVLPKSEDSLVNFFSLGCRFAGYLGPYENGVINPDKAIEYAVKMGCRTFILEIGYIEECGNYFPRIMIRDVQKKKLQSAEFSPNCLGPTTSNITQVSAALAKYAFTEAVQDPIIVVLYILELPPINANDSKRLETYYSHIADGLKPLATKRLDMLAEGGKFSNRQQESLLLTNSISNYSGSAIIMCNTNTSGPEAKVLDNLINLKLSQKQAQLGATSKSTTTAFGVLDTVQSYLSIPGDQISTVVEESKLTWTICLESNPKTITSASDYQKLTSNFGINCIPIQLWSSDSDYLFDTNGMFKKYSYVPKPKGLRYRKPPVVVAGTPSPALDAKGGALRAPQ